MRRFGTVAAAAVLVVLLVIVEVVIIRSASQFEPKVRVVFAKVKIPERTVITPDMLELKEVGVSAAHRQALRDMGAASSKRARMDIEQGEMLLEGKLGAGDAEGIRLRDSSNRLFSVEFKGDQANGWWLRADQNVDIIFIPDERNTYHAALQQQAGASGPLGEGSRAGDGAAAPAQGYMGIQVLKGIRIAALINENGKVLKDTDRDSQPRFISFEVTAAQADFLAYAKGNGRLELSAIPEVPEG